MNNDIKLFYSIYLKRNQNKELRKIPLWIFSEAIKEIGQKTNDKTILTAFEYDRRFTKRQLVFFRQLKWDSAYAKIYAENGVKYKIKIILLLLCGMLREFKWQIIYALWGSVIVMNFKRLNKIIKNTVASENSINFK